MAEKGLRAGRLS